MRRTLEFYTDATNPELACSFFILIPLFIRSSISWLPGSTPRKTLQNNLTGLFVNDGMVGRLVTPHTRIRIAFQDPFLNK